MEKEKYIRPTDEEITEEAINRGILQMIHEDPENASTSLHKRVMALETANKIVSPEAELIEKHVAEITAQCDKKEAEEKAHESAPLPPAKRKAKFGAN